MTAASKFSHTEIAIVWIILSANQVRLLERPFDLLIAKIALESD